VYKRHALFLADHLLDSGVLITEPVSEAAALLGAQADLSALVVEKHKLRGPDGKNATVSIARMAAAPSTPFSPPSVS